MRVLVCPDKFKESLSAIDVAGAITNALPHTFSPINLPLADGGEGSLATISQDNTIEILTAQVKDPLSRQIDAEWGYNPTTATAYIEMAKASGLSLLTKEEHQVSYLLSTMPIITISEQGVVLDPNALTQMGYWSTVRVAEMLPLDYTPD